MASEAGVETLSLRHGVRCVPEDGVQVEEVLLAMGEQVGCENIYSASRMNKAVVVFLTRLNLVSTLVRTGIWVRGTAVQVTPLSVPATRVLVSNVPSFIKNEVIMRELARFGSFSSPMRDVPFGCKSHTMKHVRSFRRQVLMVLNNQDEALNVNFKCKDGDRSYIVFATTERMRCFECGDIGHKRLSCPHGAVQPGSSGGDSAGLQQQQRGDGQRGNTGEPEPAAGRSDTPQAEGRQDGHGAGTTGADMDTGLTVTSGSMGNDICTEISADSGSAHNDDPEQEMCTEQVLPPPQVYTPPLRVREAPRTRTKLREKREALLLGPITKRKTRSQSVIEMIQESKRAVRERIAHTRRGTVSTANTHRETQPVQQTHTHGGTASTAHTHENTASTAQGDTASTAHTQGDTASTAHTQGDTASTAHTQGDTASTAHTQGDTASTAHTQGDTASTAHTQGDTASTAHTQKNTVSTAHTLVETTPETEEQIKSLCKPPKCESECVMQKPTAEQKRQEKTNKKIKPSDSNEDANMDNG